MRIYTKTGDQGITSLYDCSKISKSSELIDLIGDLDELNSFIGIIESNEILPSLQTWIFDLGTIIANPKHKYLFDEDLFNITRSCEGEFNGINYKTYTPGQFVPLCNECFWCKERAWAIEQQ